MTSSIGAISIFDISDLQAGTLTGALHTDWGWPHPLPQVTAMNFLQSRQSLRLWNKREMALWTLLGEDTASRSFTVRIGMGCSLLWNRHLSIYSTIEREVSGKERKEEAKVGRGISPVSQIVSKTQTDTRKKRRVG